MLVSLEDYPSADPHSALQVTSYGDPALAGGHRARPLGDGALAVDHGLVAGGRAAASRSRASAAARLSSVASSFLI